MSYLVELPVSIGASNASIVSMKKQAQSRGADVGLKAEENVEVKTDSEVTAALKAMCAGLPSEDHRRSFALMKWIEEIPGFVSIFLSTTGFNASAGLSDLVARECFALRMILIIIYIGGHAVPFTVRFSGTAGLNDRDPKIEPQAHSIN